MFCSHCGASTEGGAVVCAQCGVNLQAKVRPALNTDRAVAVSKDAMSAVKLLLRDPVGSIGAAHDALTTKQTLDVGIAFCVVFIISSLLAVRTIARFFGGSFFSMGAKEVLQAALVGVVPAACIIGILSGLQMLTAKRQDLPRSVFVGGSALLPLAALSFVAGILSTSNGEVIALVAVFSICYTILLLYAGCRDVLNVASPLAAVSVPVILLATGWLTKVILAAIL